MKCDSQKTSIVKHLNDFTNDDEVVVGYVQPFIESLEVEVNKKNQSFNYNQERN